MGRYYKLQDKELPSVTTITEQVAKPALYRYFAKHGWDEACRLGEQATSLGTQTHSYIKSFFEQEQKSTSLIESTAFFQTLQNFHDFVDKYKPESVNQELTVYSPTHGYAGTLDYLGFVTDGRKHKLVLNDWKTSGNIYPEYQLQVEAYYRALLESTLQGYTKPNFDVTQIDELWIVKLDKETKFNPERDIWKSKPDTKRFEAFLGLIKLFYWKESLKKRKRGQSKTE